METRNNIQALSMEDWMSEIRSLWAKLGLPGEFFLSGALGKEKTLPAVTYRTLERIRDPEVDGRKKYREEGTFEHPDIPGQYIMQRSKHFIARIEFRIESQSATQAEEMMERMEDILEDFEDVLARQGVLNIQFIKEDESKLVGAGAEPTAERKLIYDFRYKKVRHVNISDIEAAYVTTRVQDKKGG